jgi:hypothetical protein
MHIMSNHLEGRIKLTLKVIKVQIKNDVFLMTTGSAVQPVWPVCA